MSVKHEIGTLVKIKALVFEEVNRRSTIPLWLCNHYGDTEYSFAQGVRIHTAVLISLVSVSISLVANQLGAGIERVLTETSLYFI